MTDKQPTALRLADLLNNFGIRYATTDLDAQMCFDSADELRHLHSVNAQLLEALFLCQKQLRGLSFKDDRITSALENARAAIAAAKGET